MILNKNYINHLVLIFIASFAISFVFPAWYSEIVLFQFVFIVPFTIILLNSNKFKDLLHVILLLFTLLLVGLGLPGSAFGYLSSAIIGLFIARYYGANGCKKFNDILNKSFLIYFSCSLFILIYANDPSSFGDYFGNASINYMGLSLSSFSIIYISFRVLNLGNKGESFAEVILYPIILMFLMIFAGYFFGIRTMLISIIPFVFYILFKVRFKFSILIMIAILIIAIYINFDYLLDEFLMFIVPGRDSLFDLYSSELSLDQERFSSIFNAINHIVPQFGLCFGCSDSMSFSGLINLISLLFPFSLFLILIILNFFVNVFLLVLQKNKFSGLIIFEVLLCFFSSFLQALLQPDFFSITALFYVIGLLHWKIQSQATVIAP